MGRGMDHELEGIAWGLVFLLGVICLALIDLYWRWAKHLGERQNWLEERIEYLQRRLDGGDPTN